MRRRNQKKAAVHVFTIRRFFAQQVSIPAWARTSQREKSREKLGSLTIQGEVYVDSLISDMSTVSSGDKISTGESGEATLAVAGKGALKIRPLSQVVLSGNEQSTAELEKGTVLLNSDHGSDGLVKSR